MKKLSRIFLKYLLYIPTVKEFAVFLDSRFNKKKPGVSDWLAEIIPCEDLRNYAWMDNHIPLNQSKIAIVTTGGLFVNDKEPFRETKWGGDFSYRVLPRDVEASRIKSSRLLMDHRLTMTDPNIVFPIESLKEMKQQGLIRDVAMHHYSFLGYCSDSRPLAGGSAKEVARKLRYEGVDKVVVITASMLGQETAIRVQRAIESEEIPTVSLIYSENIARRLKPSRACILQRHSLCQLEEYLDRQMQSQLLNTLLNQFEVCKKAGQWTAID